MYKSSLLKNGWLWGVVLASLTVAYWIFSTPAADLTLSRAIEKKYVDAQIRVSDSTGGSGGSQSVTIKAHWLQGSPTTVFIRIPAGMLISNKEGNGQRLMTASTALLSVTESKPDAEMKVETYCIDQFSRIPDMKSALAALSDGNDYTEETEPLHKLAQCLELKSAPFYSRQLAIWFVGQGLLNSDRTNAQTQLASNLEKQLNLENERQWESSWNEFKERLLEQNPNRNDLDEIKSKAADNTRTAIPALALEEAQQEMNAFMREGKPLLQQCGYSLENTKLFAE